jgi:hypothetical protein
MRRRRKWLTGISVAFFALALVVVILVSTACSCLPTVYEEVEPASVPSQVMETAQLKAPGLTFHRAWRFAPDGRFDSYGTSGYLLRSQVNWYSSRDVEVQAHFPPDPLVLEPIARDPRK